MRWVIQRVINALGRRVRHADDAVSVLLDAAQTGESMSREPSDGEERDPLGELVDPLDLEVGSVKYGEGFHDYF